MRGLSLSLSLALALAGCFGGGDGGDGNGGGGSGGSNVPVPADKPLSDLNGAQLESLCRKNLASLKKVTSSNTECTAQALVSSSDQASCAAARSACLQDAPSSELSCAELGGNGTSSGIVSCSVTPAEFESCLRDLVAWVDTLSCARIGDIEAAPTCWDEQNSACPELEDLLGDGPGPVTPGRDAGTGDVDAQVGDQECIPNQQRSCTCAGGMTGVALCGVDGFFESCNCGSEPPVDAGVDPGDEGPFYCGEYEYFFDLDPACDGCGASSCCSTYEACLLDADCACFYFCTLGTIEECVVDCGLDDIPAGFYDHFDCLYNSCASECQLSE